MPNNREQVLTNYVVTCGFRSLAICNLYSQDLYQVTLDECGLFTSGFHIHKIQNVKFMTLMLFH